MNKINNTFSTTSKFIPKNLLCEYSEEPLGVDTTSPRLSWIVDCPERGQYQTAYQILVSSSQRNIESNYGDMWNSGKVNEDQSINVVYSGKKLTSRKVCYWKVRIWDREGKVNPYSSISKFEMGLLDSKDWQGKWIGFYDDGIGGIAPLFRKEFILNKTVKRARIYIAGLGYYELRLNGQKVGDHVLDPGWTEYGKRVFYVTYSVENYLKLGNNVIGIILGNGQFNFQANIKVFKYSGWTGDERYGRYGLPRMTIQMNIEFSDGSRKSIVSGSSLKSGWLVSKGPIIHNNIFEGESYDARLEKIGWDIPNYKVNDFKEWTTPISVESPGGIMVSQMMEPIKAVMEIKPIQVTNPKPAIYIYDMGQNMAGWIRLRVNGQRGTKVQIKYAENLYNDGTVNQENLRTAISIDTYILKGDKEEVYEPRFTYHGFRFVQIEGYPGIPDLDNITGIVVHSSVEQIGKFDCSNDLLNKIYNNALWTEMSNQHSIPTDNCQRDERMAWLGDMTVRAEGAIYMFNMSRFYKKWLDDIEDARDKKTGVISDTAPYRYGKVPADTICSCYLLIPWLLYIHYNDRRVLEQHYDGMKNWVDFLGKQASDYIIPYSYYGDWAPPIKESIIGSIGHSALSANTPPELIATAYYYYDVLIMSKIAKILGKYNDETNYLNLLNFIKDAFNNKFLNPNTSQYAKGSQSSNVFPLFLGLVPERNKKSLINNLIKDIIEKHKCHLSTGHCTKYLMDTLTNISFVDVAYTIATQTTYPSWGFMILNGATTIWERWELLTGSGTNSLNQGSGSYISTWFYKGLAGIITEWNNPPLNKFIIKPHIPEGLKYVNASIKTIKGLVLSNWRKESNSLIFNIEIPFNSKARIYIPEIKKITNKIIIQESDKIIWKDNKYIGGVKGIIDCQKENNCISFDVGSGKYCFKEF